MKILFPRKKHLHFIHIGKTAGTALKHALSDYTDSRHAQIYLHGHDFKLTDLPDNQYCFFSVRDPIDRFVSAFYSRQRQGKPRYNSKWSVAEELSFSLFVTPNQLANDLYSDNWKKRVNAEYAMLSIRHINNSYWDWFIDERYFLSRKKSIVFIFDQTSLNSDFEEFKKRFSISKKALLPDRNSVNAHSNNVSFNTKLNKVAELNLKRWYAKEYVFVDLVKKHFSL